MVHKEWSLRQRICAEESDRTRIKGFTEDRPSEHPLTGIKGLR